MQPIIIEQPYSFIPPRFSGFWMAVVRGILPRVLRKSYGVCRIECHGVEKLRASLAADHGIILAPNHCRPCDPMVLDSLAREAGRPFEIMASWHVFKSNRLQGFLLRRIGGFSVNREGLDRESLKHAVATLNAARHPLVIFPEGFITRTNDHLAELMDGPAFIARLAAKQRNAKTVVVHPVFIRYHFKGDLQQTSAPVLQEIERRLSWQPQIQLSLLDRAAKIADALLALKELEYFGTTGRGGLHQRLVALQTRLLTPLENQWCAGRSDGGTISRVKRLRSAILGRMLDEPLPPADHAACWRGLADLYLVQQLHCYPEDYLASPTPERILETIERFEEDLTDTARAHPPLHAVITVGDAIPVPPNTTRGHGGDPITRQLHQRLQELLVATSRTRQPS